MTPTIEELVPHRGPLSLLGRVVAWSPGNVRCHADLRPDNPLLAPDGTLPAWALVEVVAQAAAALRGLEALDAGSTAAATGSTAAASRVPAGVSPSPTRLARGHEARLAVGPAHGKSRPSASRAGRKGDSLSPPVGHDADATAQTPGYLVAVRDASFAAPSIPVGARLEVEVWREGEPRLGMATLRGQVDWQGRTVCEVTLTVKES